MVTQGLEQNNKSFEKGQDVREDNLKQVLKAVLLILIYQFDV